MGEKEGVSSEGAQETELERGGKHPLLPPPWGKQERSIFVFWPEKAVMPVYVSSFQL